MTEKQKEAAKRLASAVEIIGVDGCRELELVALGMAIESERREAEKHD